MKPHMHFASALTGLALLLSLHDSYSLESDLVDIKAEITKRHDEAVKRLQEWIAQISIAAEDRG